MEAYRVTHKRSGETYYLLGRFASDAIERLTLMIEDPEGMAAWNAAPDTPPHRLTQGVLLDANGKLVKTLEA